MEYFFKEKKRLKVMVGALLALVLLQSFVILNLYSTKDDKNYEVNLVKVKDSKDSLDLDELKSSLVHVDETVRSLNGFLRSKNIANIRIEQLAEDSLANSVYLTEQSQRYSEYLAQLQKQLQQIPLGAPSQGYISSNFGQRKNPIPPKVLLASMMPTAKAEAITIEERDSLGNVVKKTFPAIAGKTAPKVASVPMQNHKGIDFASPYGSDVFAAAEGKVIFAGVKGGYGNCVIISHGNGLSTLYGHLSQLNVKPNQQVKVGQLIAKSGNSGRSTGPHLHYEVHKNNTPVNPKLFLNI